ncbi:MAG: PAS domain-containing protein [Planctomycetia bacterium]|nr:PAS domain-containing protein [Planctomycetia bacterium]
MPPPLEGNEAPRGSELKPPQRAAAIEVRDEVEQLRRQVEEQRREIAALTGRQHQLEVIINNTPAVIYMKDADGRYVLVNRTFSELFHIGVDDMVGRTDAEIFPGELGAKFRSNDLYVQESGQATEFEEVAPHDDGPHTYMSLKVPVTNPISGDVGIFGISMDVTAAKRAQIALRDSQRLYSSLVETLPVALFRKNLAGELTFVNERFCQYIGRAEQELIGRTDFDLFSTDLAEKYRSDDDQVIREEAICDEVEEQQVRGGQKRYVHVIKSPVYDARHRVCGVQGLFWDETERLLAEQSLRRMTLELARSNQELQHFAYVASHDLQEPLRKVVAYGQRAAARGPEAMDEATRDYVDRMVAAALRMKTMIDDLLALARVTMDRRPFEWIDLNEIAHGVLDDLEVTIDELKAEVALDVLPTVEADPAQMRQLFQNLLGNSLKYGRPGIPPRLEVRAQRVDGPRLREDCELRFIDNGQGFDVRYSERIFQPFERLHSADDVPGSGIGLAICRRIVERHEGRISATSEPGHGATFTITLPVHQSTPESIFNSAML